MGHTRYRALLELGAETVSVVRPKLSKQKVKEYRIADNKVGEIAEWDRDPLIAELRALEDAGREMAPFFGERDLTAILADSGGLGVAHRPVTADQMDKVLNRHEAGVADMTKARVSSQIELECPSCGERFWLDRSTIEEHPGDRT